MTEIQHPKIRFASEEDLPAVVDIYNQAIRIGIATGHTDEFTVPQRKLWFENFSRNEYPIYVIEFNKKVIGYGTLSQYRPGRKAMKSIAEISFFLDQQYQGKGLGSILLKHIINDCPRLGKKTLLAILFDINQKSIGLLKKFGFEKWGYFPDVVELDGKRCGQLIYGLKLSGSGE